MKYVYKTLFTAIAAALVIGLVGCTTTKNEPAPAAPEPVMAPKADRN